MTVALSAIQPFASMTAAVEAAGRGDHAAWDFLFDRYHALVRRYALARLGEAAAADDVAQECFVAAVGALHRLRERSEQGVEAWLLGIARFKIADRVRAAQRERRLPALTTAAPPAADAGELAVSRIHVAEVREAMQRLSPDQREVIERRFLLDQSLEEVAAATGRRVGAVKSLQHRALAALARICREAS